MPQDNFLRSPFFYVGDKFKLLKSIHKLFPRDIENYYEPFLGGGSVFLNIEAKKYFLNDVDKHVYELHKFLISQTNNDDFINELFNVIKNYQLSLSCKDDIVPIEMKRKFNKTYFAHFNREGYLSMRNDYSKTKSPLLLYLLIIYGFNRMIRFNKKGEFNIPVGNVDFNSNVLIALKGYFSFVKNRKITLQNFDFSDFLSSRVYKNSDFVYCDPPYLITSSEYNKIWSLEKEKQLLNKLDYLNKMKVRFAISNVTNYKEEINQTFIDWMKQYSVFEIKSNYISYHDNSVKKFREVLVRNY